MKTKLYILFLFAFCVFISCSHPDLGGYHHGGGEVAFFQFTDTTLLNKIVLNFHSPESFKSKYFHAWGDRCWIPLYPKNLEGQPFFGEDQYLGTNHLLDWKVGDFYTLKDLVNTPKYIPLKDGYYICYPFTELVSSGCYINAEWKDLLTIDMDTIEVYTSMPYANRYVIHEDELVRLTNKSTMHFRGLRKDMITIDDIVLTLNKLIETNTIQDHCYAIQQHCE